MAEASNNSICSFSSSSSSSSHSFSLSSLIFNNPIWLRLFSEGFRESFFEVILVLYNRIMPEINGNKIINNVITKLKVQSGFSFFIAKVKYRIGKRGKINKYINK